MMTWVPAVFFLAVLIDFTTSSLQEVHMPNLTNKRGFFFSMFRSTGSVLTSIVRSAVLI